MADPALSHTLGDVWEPLIANLPTPVASLAAARRSIASSVWL